ncbi:hypothetical protein SKAU_G00136990 [Synaphobranchus kaupii]|uniref:Uncharacterized protein n=1 Tax=Synaphobranchus kaupii TaxID=118154 RepID=A0A9Q1FSK2_SYNKA|nr:hypothetical protein SKAU_G00136990 [Synaphobranchus kaupii]
MTPVFYDNGPERRRGGLMRRLGCGKTTGLFILGLISILVVASTLLLPATTIRERTIRQLFTSTTVQYVAIAQNESDTTQEDPEDPSQNPQFSTPQYCPATPMPRPHQPGQGLGNASRQPTNEPNFLNH